MNIRPVFRDAIVRKHRIVVRDGQMKYTLSFGNVSEKHEIGEAMRYWGLHSLSVDSVCLTSSGIRLIAN